MPAFEITALAPNPTGGRLRLGVAAPERTRLRLEVFDVLGRRVLTLPEATVEAGRLWLGLDASALPSGVYILRPRAQPEGGRASATVLSRKFTVVR